MTLGVGVIGCGRAGRELHLPALARVAGARVVALADADPGRLQAARAASGVERCFDDDRSLLEDGGVDVALVAVPPDGYAEIVRECIERGKHVLVEKPLAASTGEARELVGLARGVEVVTAVGHNLRCHRLLIEARALIVGGAIGEIETARSVWSSDIALRSDLPDWRSRRDTLGGVIHEMGIHHFDLWRFLLDVEIEEIAALSRPGERDDDSTAISCRMAGGVPVTMLLSQRGPVQLELEVLGSEGRLRVDCYRFDGLEVDLPGASRRSLRGRLGGVLRTARQLPAGIRVARRGGDFLDTYCAEWERMLAAVAADGDAACTFDDGYRAVLAAHAAARSAATGEMISLRDDLEAAPV